MHSHLRQEGAAADVIWMRLLALRLDAADVPFAFASTRETQQGIHDNANDDRENDYHYDNDDNGQIKNSARLRRLRIEHLDHMRAQQCRARQSQIHQFTSVMEALSQCENLRLPSASRWERVVLNALPKLVVCRLISAPLA